MIPWLRFLELGIVGIYLIGAILTWRWLKRHKIFDKTVDATDYYFGMLNALAFWPFIALTIIMAPAASRKAGKPMELLTATERKAKREALRVVKH